MFLDSLVGDAAWRAKYALDRAGGVLPWDIHEADVRAKHPQSAASSFFLFFFFFFLLRERKKESVASVSRRACRARETETPLSRVGFRRYEVFALRGMLAVPYFEKALYELEEVTDAAVTALADKIEREIQGGLSARPLPQRPASRREWRLWKKRRGLEETRFRAFF